VLCFDNSLENVDFSQGGIAQCIGGFAKSFFIENPNLGE